MFLETPAVSPNMVWFKDESYHQLSPASLEINWDPFNLTMRADAKVEGVTKNMRLGRRLGDF